jgi:hypothetical protein
MPDWFGTAEPVLLTMMCCVLALRAPSIRSHRQRPILFVLLPLTVGTLSLQLLQDKTADRLNQLVGIDQINQLVVSLIAMTDFAAVWWFAIQLQFPDSDLRWVPGITVLLTAPVLIGFFAVTPASLRYDDHANSWWIGFAITWICFCTINHLGAATLLISAGRSVTRRTLKVSIFLMAAGSATEIPYLIIRALRWFTSTPPSLANWNLLLSFIRFALVAFGCCLAATQPLLRTLRDYYHYRRLAPLWAVLTTTTPHLHTTPTFSRSTGGCGWELLHQRIIDIHDSLTVLHAHATPQLHAEAHRYSTLHAPAHHRRIAALAYITAEILDTTPALETSKATSRPLDPLTATELLHLHRIMSQNPTLRRSAGYPDVGSDPSRSASSRLPNRRGHYPRKPALRERGGNLLEPGRNACPPSVTADTAMRSNRAGRNNHRRRRR